MKTAWRLIDTAPKDGSRLLLFGVERGFLPPRVFIGRWTNERWMGPQTVAKPTRWAEMPDEPEEDVE